MKPIHLALRAIAPTLLLTAALAQAATVTGTVTDKTNGKPAAGDTVVLLDVQANMAEVAHAKTNAQGHYTLSEPGPGPYLIRDTHQGAGYFIAAPQDGGPGDIPVYDVAAKVGGVHIEADVLEFEANNGQLKVDERFFVHNLSSPPITQWSPRSFEVVLPPGAVVNGAGAQRPGGLPTSVNVEPTGQKNRYAFNFPIQPDDGEKDTLFQISYNLPYTGKLAFHSEVTLPADNFAVLMPKSMTFTGASFQSVQEDPTVQTYIVKNAAADKPIDFTIAGTGSIPREAQGQQSDQQPAAGNSAAAGNGGQPGGGIGTPIDTPDPLTKYKWWILGGVALLLATIAAFLLRKPAMAGAAAGAGGLPAGAAPAVYAATAAQPSFSAPTANGTNHAALLNALKEELFAIESERISGTLEARDYDEVKAALETVLKRALKRNS
ncbi:MAG: carboxypeptidase-like regulatory domain-containing protein [Terracidiphilus sp.]